MGRKAETRPGCAGKCAKGFYCPADILNTHAYGATPNSNPPWKQITAGYYGSAGSSTSNLTFARLDTFAQKVVEIRIVPPTQHGQ